MTQKIYSVPNISCGHCVMTIQKELKFIKGLEDVQANQTDKTVSVTVQNPDVLKDVEATLEEIGYPVAG